MVKADYTLYLVTDRNLLQGRELISEVRKAVRGGVTLVQLREKEAKGREFYELASLLKRELDSLGIPLIVNDRLDIALMVDASGVHLGQEDLPCMEARRILGAERLVGITVGSVLEAQKAEREGASYVGLGPIYFTATKPDASQALGVNIVKEVKKAVSIPVVGIGGIDLENIREVKRHGADGVAVVSALMTAEDIEDKARRLREAWENA